MIVFVVNLTTTLILSIPNNPMCEVAIILEHRPLFLFFLQMISRDCKHQRVYASQMLVVQGILTTFHPKMFVR
jgi:hypothetical protein